MLAFTHLVDLQPDFLSYYNHWHYHAIKTGCFIKHLCWLWKGCWDFFKLIPGYVRKNQSGKLCNLNWTNCNQLMPSAEKLMGHFYFQEIVGGGASDHLFLPKGETNITNKLNSCFKNRWIVCFLFHSMPSESTVWMKLCFGKWCVDKSVIFG